MGGLTLGGPSGILGQGKPLQRGVTNRTPNPGAYMSRTARWLVLPGILVLALSQSTQALGLGGIGLRVGMDLAQNEVNYDTGTQFDSARLVLGGHVDMGSIFFPKFHLVPGMDVVLQDDLRIYSINSETRYYFTRGERASGYAGIGLGVHLYRFDLANPVAGGPQNNTKLSMNIPVGFQRGLGSGLQWFGELKLVIADDEVDSSFQFSLGILTNLGL